jgi:hypothetical protein
MRLGLGSPRGLAEELPWLGLTAAALVVTLALEHFVVHRQIVLPALALTPRPPIWMFAAMVVPELVVFFAAGYRLRTWLAVLMYAAVGGVLRSGFQLALALAGEPGHTDALHTVSEFALATPAVTVGYLVVLGLAAWSGEDERRLAGGA